MNSIVPETWKIPPQLIARFGDSAGKQRAMNAEGHLLLVLHNPDQVNNTGLERKAKLLWRAPSGAWACNSDGSETDLLKKHVASFAALVEQLENKVQEADGADDYFRLLQAIGPLHRSSRNLHSTLQQAREMVSDDREIIVARDSAGDIERALELLHLDAKNGLDYTVARKSELQSQQTYEMAVSAHRLNILAAIFFPITALSSIFAMNPALAPEHLLHTASFWTVVGAGTVSGLLLSRTLSKTIQSSPKPIARNQSRYGAQANKKGKAKPKPERLRQAF